MNEKISKRLNKLYSKDTAQKASESIEKLINQYK